MHEIPTQAMRASNAKLIIRALGLQLTGFRAIKSMLPGDGRLSLNVSPGRRTTITKAGDCYWDASDAEEACAERP